MHGEQPLKFYSKQITETKIALVHRLMKTNPQKSFLNDLDQHHKEWGKQMTS